ncbi:uncharacterized protein LOC115925246 [Strongylocentrotus purpuratus]|uniref:NIDO domain-containing protein n=1 Tax=Strongylocentrotus purpuratus TaxID=7668 RepID=A0A7M7P1G1_STRPU|nr:uncharacterized protein LOC115925246 [Strongylocentrotus purpuratus]
MFFKVFESSTDAGFFSALRNRLRTLEASPWGADNNDVIDTLSTAVMFTWKDFQPPGSIPGEELLTYQAIVFTNGARTGVLMFYEQGSFSWDPQSKAVPVRIGYNSRYAWVNRFQESDLNESYKPDQSIGSQSGTQVYTVNYMILNGLQSVQGIYNILIKHNTFQLGMMV